MQNCEPTLRERRRERTWKAIHEAAVELVKKNGLKQTTTDEIAERAGISSRTFFNYFATKEDAVLGLREPQITPAMIQADQARQQSYVFDRVVHLLLDVVVESIPATEHRRYRELGKKYPEFRTRFKVYLLKCERVVEDFLRTIDWQDFAANNRRGPFRFLKEGAEVNQEYWGKARASVTIASAILRYMDFSQGLPEGEARDQVVRESVDLFRDLLRED